MLIWSRPMASPDPDIARILRISACWRRRSSWLSAASGASCSSGWDSAVSWGPRSRFPPSALSFAGPPSSSAGAFFASRSSRGLFMSGWSSAMAIPVIDLIASDGDAVFAGGPRAHLGVRRRRDRPARPHAGVSVVLDRFACAFFRSGRRDVGSAEEPLVPGAGELLHLHLDGCELRCAQSAVAGLHDVAEELVGNDQ